MRKLIVDLFTSILRVLALLLLIAGFLYLRGCLARPPRDATVVQLTDEVTYERIIREIPQRMIIHVAEATLSEQTALFMNYPDRPNAQLPYLAKKTTTFLQETNALLAINAGYFEPFRPGVPFYFYPRIGDPIAPIGMIMGRGEILRAANDWVELCIEERRVLIMPEGCSAESLFAVAGSDWLIRDGQAHPFPASNDNTRLYPRTAIATNADGTHVWLIVIDGLQRGYSAGASLTDLQQIGEEFGVTHLLNLDGGGSSTMAIDGANGVYLANAPFHTWIPMRERPIANFIGVWVKGR